ncbi:MAG: alpha/beta hydrolase [Sphingomonadales bacterium]|nr:alpha/beta hydrolase [Sphingomonadales bacterium]
MSANPPACPPAWLTRALASAGESCLVEVAGTPIHYLRWGARANPGLALIAGAGGHAHWFDAIAPLLAEQYHVIAIDPGGCGDSGHRAAYATELVITEIMAACADAGLLSAPAAPVLVGHSAGGQFALRAALAHGAALRGVIALDALRYAELPGDPALRPREARPMRAPRLHADRASAVARFRFTPEPRVPIGLPALTDAIAGHSVREYPGGWGWKFDPGFGAILSAGLDLRDRLGEIRCRVAAIYGEHTHIAGPDAVARVGALGGGRVATFVIPGAGHYPMLDSPLACVAALRGVLAAWDACAP